MPTFIVVGRSDCADFARVERLGEQLSFDISSSAFSFQPQHPNDWDKFLTSLCAKFDLPARLSGHPGPLVFTSEGKIIGVLTQLVDYVAESFSIDIGYLTSGGQTSPAQTGKPYAELNKDARTEQYRQQNQKDVSDQKARAAKVQQGGALSLADRISAHEAVLYSDSAMESRALVVPGTVTEQNLFSQVKTRIDNRDLQKGANKEEVSLLDRYHKYLSPTPDYQKETMLQGGIPFNVWKSNRLRFRQQLQIHADQQTSFLPKALIIAPLSSSPQLVVHAASPICRQHLCLVPRRSIAPLPLKQSQEKGQADQKITKETQSAQQRGGIGSGETKLPAQTPRFFCTGPTGSGVSTQSSLLAKRWGLVKLVLPRLYRTMAALGEAGAKTALQLVAHKLPVPAALRVELLKKRIEMDDCKKFGFVVGGFPKTPEDAVALASEGIIPDAIFLLDASLDTVQFRLSSLRKDPETNKLIHLMTNPPPDDVRFRLVCPPKYTKENIDKAFAEDTKSLSALQTALGWTNLIIRVNCDAPPLPLPHLLMPPKPKESEGEEENNEEEEAPPPLPPEPDMYVGGRPATEVLSDLCAVADRIMEKKFIHPPSFPVAAGEFEDDRQLLKRLAELPPAYLPAAPRKKGTERRPHPVHLYVLGAPGSGRFALCKELEKSLGLVHVAVETVLKRASAAASKGGRVQQEVAAKMARGLPVDDETLVEAIRLRLLEADCVERGWCLEGFPKTAKQVLLLEKRQISPHVLLNLQAPPAVLVQRLRGRRVDPVTGERYHLEFMPPPSNVEVVNRLERLPEDKLLFQDVSEEEMEDAIRAQRCVLDFCRDVSVDVDASPALVEVVRKSVEVVEKWREGVKGVPGGLKGTRPTPSTTLRVLVTGPPGSGKHSACHILHSLLGLEILDVEDLADARIAASRLLPVGKTDPVAEELQAARTEGKPFPEEAGSRLVADAVSKGSSTEKGWALTGFPLTSGGATLLEKKGVSPSLWLDLSSPPEKLFARRVHKQVDSLTGEPFHPLLRKPASALVKGRLTDPRDPCTDAAALTEKIKTKVSIDTSGDFENVALLVREAATKAAGIVLSSSSTPSAAPAAAEETVKEEAEGGETEKETEKEKEISPSDGRAQMKIFVVGAPASGKTTQCRLLAEKFGLTHIDPLTLLVEKAQREEGARRLLQDLNKHGIEPPDEAVVRLIEEALAREKKEEGDEDDTKRSSEGAEETEEGGAAGGASASKETGETEGKGAGEESAAATRGWCLDGFPKTEAQALALERAGIRADLLFFLHAPPRPLIERIVFRRTDPETGETFHLKTNPPADDRVRARFESGVLCIALPANVCESELFKGVSKALTDVVEYKKRGGDLKSVLREITSRRAQQSMALEEMGDGEGEDVPEEKKPGATSSAAAEGGAEGAEGDGDEDEGNETGGDGANPTAAHAVEEEEEVNKMIVNEILQVPLRVILQEKTEVAEALSKRFGLAVITPENLFKWAKDQPPGNAASDAYDRHISNTPKKPISDALLASLLASRITQTDVSLSGWVLTDIPRTKAQQSVLANEGIFADCLLLLELPDDLIKERVTGRRLDPETGKIYHLKYTAPEDIYAVQNRLVQRDEDREETLAVEMKTYEEAAGALLEAYADNNTKTDASKALDDVTPPGSDLSSVPVLQMMRKRLDAPHISVASLLKWGNRARVKEAKAIEEAVKKEKAAGNENAKIPDDLLVQLLAVRLSQPDCRHKGWILDNIPDSTAQSELLTGLGDLAKEDLTLSFNFPAEKIIARMGQRRWDPETNQIYDPPAGIPLPEEEEVKDRLLIRAEDSDEGVMETLRQYAERTEELLAAYRKRLCAIDGSKGTKAVFLQTLSAVLRMKGTRRALKGGGPDSLREPFTVIVGGAPGSGKSEQSARLSEVFGLVHVHPDEAVADAEGRGTDPGKEAKAVKQKGEPLSDETIVAAIRERLEQPDCEKNGWVLDGFPLTERQASLLQKNGGPAGDPSVFLYLDVEEENLKERILLRRYDEVTGIEYNLKLRPPPPKPEVRARLVRREEDGDAKFSERYEAHKETFPGVVDKYIPVLCVADGAPVSSIVFSEVCKKVERAVVRSKALQETMDAGKRQEKEKETGGDMDGLVGLTRNSPAGKKGNLPTLAGPSEKVVVARRVLSKTAEGLEAEDWAAISEVLSALQGKAVATYMRPLISFAHTPANVGADATSPLDSCVQILPLPLPPLSSLSGPLGTGPAPGLLAAPPDEKGPGRFPLELPVMREIRAAKSTDLLEEKLLIPCTLPELPFLHAVVGMRKPHESAAKKGPKGGALLQAAFEEAKKLLRNTANKMGLSTGDTGEVPRVSLVRGHALWVTLDALFLVPLRPTGLRDTQRAALITLCPPPPPCAFLGGPIVIPSLPSQFPDTLQGEDTGENGKTGTAVGGSKGVDESFDILPPLSESSAKKGEDSAKATSPLPGTATDWQVMGKPEEIFSTFRLRRRAYSSPLDFLSLFCFPLAQGTSSSHEAVKDGSSKKETVSHRKE
uniref:Adenylate kinase n=1 Tax=Chromera velia CCMP2878 TaxID=1169474 RepID=A0A0G4GRD5_9ALVE|eukprot:Cvel_23040.t1-p1 / transcript=Cvel_23040.t1 / gene=Cvel_23040 / organism=Chromera_velia_CCMP2878 / gene_product=Adenylate kinase 8, putative / transcript_product=Adenylate kinase 8, putative / location=Cvel_scaffold2329:13513-28683(-) / protein_length=2513 / sequence_SO=supercontig / SO=protein_coding / is_pseudo=false